MVTSETWGRRSLFTNDRWAKLLIDTLYHYRGQAYALHEFVVMPEHIHVLLTPQTSLEKAVQFIKGGFSCRVTKDLQSNMEVWQTGFQDHRIRDASDYAAHVFYIHENPVKRGLCQKADDYAYSSADPRYDLDGVPQGLKPSRVWMRTARLKARPFKARLVRLELYPFKARRKRKVHRFTIATEPLHELPLADDQRPTTNF